MGVLIAQATHTQVSVHCTCRTRLLNPKRELFSDFIESPEAGYPRSEGSGARVKFYLGRDTAARPMS